MQRSLNNRPISKTIITAYSFLRSIHSQLEGLQLEDRSLEETLLMQRSTPTQAMSAPYPPYPEIETRRDPERGLTNPST